VCARARAFETFEYFKEKILKQIFLTKNVKEDK